MGKVHGSLARAGKVKSQTPKVSQSVLQQASFDTAAANVNNNPPNEPAQVFVQDPSLT